MYLFEINLKKSLKPGKVIFKKREKAKVSSITKDYFWLILYLSVIQGSVWFF